MVFLSVYNSFPSLAFGTIQKDNQNEKDIHEKSYCKTPDCSIAHLRLFGKSKFILSLGSGYFLLSMKSAIGWGSMRFDDPSISVTRLGDLLDFGQLFKAFGNN